MCGHFLPVLSIPVDFAMRNAFPALIGSTDKFGTTILTQFFRPLIARDPQHSLCYASGLLPQSDEKSTPIWHTSFYQRFLSIFTLCRYPTSLVEICNEIRPADHSRWGAVLCKYCAAQFSESPIHSSAKRGASLTRSTISFRVASICSGVRTVESGFASREPM